MSDIVKTLEKQLNSDLKVSVGHAIAGGLAGATANTILFPISQIATRKAAKSGKISTYNELFNDLIRLRNINDHYKGLKFSLLQSFLFQGIFFYFFQTFKQKYPNPTTIQSIIGGSIAGILTQLFTTPIKVLQIRTQTSKTDETPLQIIQSILEMDGVTGFWRGMKANSILVINPAITNLIYDNLKTVLKSMDVPEGIIGFFAGGLSKLMATIICYPLVWAKIQIQAQTKESKKHNINTIASDTNNVSYKPLKNGYTNGKKRVSFQENMHKIGMNGNNNRSLSMSDVFMNTYKDEGVQGFYHGMSTKLIDASLTYAFLYSSKEKFVLYILIIMNFMAKKNKKIPMKTTQIKTSI